MTDRTECNCDQVLELKQSIQNLTAAEILTWAIAQSGLSQNQVAKKYGVSYSNMCRWARGDRDPKFNDLAGVCEMLGYKLNVQLEKE